MESIRKILENRKAARDKTANGRLSKIINKKCLTILIGSLSIIEKHFEYLWKDDEEMRAKWAKCREEILDYGHLKIHGINNELSEYEVFWKAYHAAMSVVKENNND